MTPNTPPYHLLSVRKLFSYLFIVATATWLILFGVVDDTGKSGDDIIYNQTADKQECRLPYLDAWDGEIVKYIYELRPLVCNEIQGELTYLENYELFVNESSVNGMGLTGPDLDFNYRCFGRGEDDFSVKYSEWTPFIAKTHVTCQFIEVLATTKFTGTQVYRYHHSQVLSINKTKFDKDRKSVFIFVLDSVSHSNFVRKLPKTLDLLKGEKYRSIVMNGMTKVGDNSFPNAVSFLTGKRVMVEGYPDEISTDGGYFDSWPLIWKDFKSLNYTTLYAEDLPDFNLFTYLAKGFKNQPTDYYLRPFLDQIYNSWIHKRSSYLCYNKQKKHNIQLKYLTNFLSKTDGPFFALNWLTELGHDYINQIEYGDQDIYQFFLDNHQRLEESFVFVLGDHGHRFDSIRQTITGRLEERLPFFSVSLPRSLYHTHKHLLIANSDKLTSFYDFHSTLEHILNLEKSIKGEGDVVRGRSLLANITKFRSCEDAGIPEEFCVCQRLIEVDVGKRVVREMADVLVEHINNITNKHNCQRLELTKIMHAEMILDNHKLIQNRPWYGKLLAQHHPPPKYQLTLQLKPGYGIFEGLLSKTSNGYEVKGSINRINKYSTQSHCVSTQILKKFCFCKDTYLGQQALPSIQSEREVDHAAPNPSRHHGRV